MKKIVVWFRKDLRLHDNPALLEATKQGEVLPIFIWSIEEEKELQGGEASLWWLHHSLFAFKKTLQSMGIPLVLRMGNSLTELKDIIEQVKADAVFLNERYEPSIVKRDQLIINELQSLNIEVRTFHSHLLFNPSQLLNNQFRPYKVFSPFYKRCLKENISRPAPVPKKVDIVKDEIPSVQMEDLRLLSSIGWHQKFNYHWKPGEKEAIQRWQCFSENELLAYRSGRDFPAQEMVSRLSPYLAWGDISARAIWHSAKRILDESVEGGNERIHEHFEAFLRQLIWRDFGYHQLVHFPSMIDTELREPFYYFPWTKNDDDFNSWKRGMTGYPLVDAGMRELWETGTMHNRIRMVTASFLVKHLLIHWQEGASWFKETLVDYDVANNSMGWQWTAGCGFDAAPYFRIFNPITQSEKFDKNGEYIRRWVPEIASLPAPYIHRPWEAPEEVLNTAGIKLGVNYPYPMIEHSFARNRALEAYERIK